MTADTQMTGGGPTPTRRRSETRGIDFSRATLWVVVAFLVYQVIVPLAFLLWGSFQLNRPTDDAYLSVSGLSFKNYTAALGGMDFWQAMGNTMIYSVGSTVLSAVIGIALAIVVARTDAPFRATISTLNYIRIIIPGLLTAADGTGNQRIEGMANNAAKAWVSVAHDGDHGDFAGAAQQADKAAATQQAQAAQAEAAL